MSDTDSHTITWPPNDNDFLQVAKNAYSHKKTFTSVLVYIDNQEYMIFDPVHFSPAPSLQKGFNVTNSKGDITEFNVILSKYD